MPQGREIKRRIQSVENTRQITRAMKMVAAAKLQRAQARMLALRPYADRLGAIIGDVSDELFGDEHPLFSGRPEEHCATIVIAGDRGVCGGFNSNVIRRAQKHFADSADTSHDVWSIGKRATTALKKTADIKIVRDYHGVFDDLSYRLAYEICDGLTEQYLAGDIDAVYLVYSEFVTVICQRPVATKLMPLDFGATLERREAPREDGVPGTPATGAPRSVCEIEPDPESVMKRLVSRLLATRVYHATLESYAAELGARMTAMDNATKNAEEMIAGLTVEFNRARQASITAELLDIVGGAEALV